MTIGSRIAKCRKEKNLSQEYIAEMLEVSRQAVSKWECDLTEPDTGNLIALSNLLGVSVEYLAKGDTEEKADLLEKSFPTLKIIGIILIALGGLSCIMGVITPLMLSVGAIAVFFGVFVLLLQRDGILLGLSTIVLAVALFFVQGFTGGVDTPVMILILSISIVFPLFVYGMIKIVKKMKNGELKTLKYIKGNINKKSIMITIIVIIGVIMIVVSGILVNNARKKAFAKSTWFSAEYLVENDLEGLPGIGGERKAKLGDSRVFIEMKSQENYEMYVKDHLLGMYLSERHFRHLGTRGSIISCNSGSVIYELAPGDDISDFRHYPGKYVFVISNTRASSGEVDATIISLEWVGKQYINVEGKNISYNVIMSIYPENHTESYALRSAAAYGITYEGDASIYYGVPPMTAIANMNVTVRVNALDGAYIALYANNSPIQKVYECDEYIEFSFTMPSENVVISSKIIGNESNAPSDDNLKYYEKWLIDLSSDDVSEIKIKTILNPELYEDPFANIESTSDREIISILLEQYKNMVLDIDTEGFIPDEGATHITASFVLSDGTIKEIEFMGGCYISEDGAYFQVAWIPTLMSHDSKKIVYSINLLVSDDEYVVRTMDGEAVAHIEGLSSLEFLDCLGEAEYKAEDYLCYIETEVGTLYVCSDTIFEFIPSSSWATFCFKLRYGSLSEHLDMTE